MNRQYEYLQNVLYKLLPFLSPDRDAYLVSNFALLIYMAFIILSLVVIVFVALMIFEIAKDRIKNKKMTTSEKIKREQKKLEGMLTKRDDLNKMIRKTEFAINTFRLQEDNQKDEEVEEKNDKDKKI